MQRCAVQSPQPGATSACVRQAANHGAATSPKNCGQPKPSAGDLSPIRISPLRPRYGSDPYEEGSEAWWTHTHDLHQSSAGFPGHASRGCSCCLFHQLHQAALHQSGLSFKSCSRLASSLSFASVVGAEGKPPYLVFKMRLSGSVSHGCRLRQAGN